MGKDEDLQKDVQNAIKSDPLLNTAKTDDAANNVISKTDDEQITSEVIDAIKNNLEVPNDKIKVKVEVGKATLEGELKWHYQKEAVKSVNNQIGIKNKTNKIMTASETKDENEKKQIEYALLRNWSVDDENVQVKVSANKVTLKGIVHSLFQRNEIERIASCTPGVSTVENELVIEYK